MEVDALGCAGRQGEGEGFTSSPSIQDTDRPISDFFVAKVEHNVQTASGTPPAAQRAPAVGLHGGHPRLHARLLLRAKQATCLITSVCPCISFGQIVEIMDRRNTSKPATTPSFVLPPYL
ncbi:hypothetical protein Taro_038707 [Colocasia esculenta]|uniref:Uncharacterized protein n=1 Tax=Colocasia esculenta TaxID=4460 RepID=A0A843W7F4_COLES|nr:hypothetical protein [Colocasia esculenta]